MSVEVTAALGLLESAFDGRLVIPDSTADYEAAVTSPWSQICWTPAAGFVQLRTAQELSEALAIMKQTKCKFSIRSTGHNPNVGFSSADETAIVLDISKLLYKELTQNGIAHIGGGNTWGDVYTWLEEQGLSVIGARQEEVGLGGFLLGGGMGALPNLHGLGADNVKNFEVLLANGKVISANSTENSDLFRALKGGGSNFGIVTRFDLQTYPLIKVQATISLYNPQDYVEIIKATVSVQEEMEKDPNIGLFCNFNVGFVAVGMIYAKGTDEQQTAFEPFHNLTSLISEVMPRTNGTLLSLAKSMSHSSDLKKRVVYSATTKVSQELYQDAYRAWVDVCKTLPIGAVLHFTIQPMGTVGIQKGKDNGGNILGLENVPQSWWVFTCEWPREVDDDAAVENAARTLAQRVCTSAMDRGLLLEYLCMSFASSSQDVLRSYGSENTRIMRETTERYDPDGFFQKLQHDGFLLRQVS